MYAMLAEARGGTLPELPELRDARAEAVVWCEALAALCRDSLASPAELFVAAQRASLAAGRVAGFAHLSR